MGSILGWGAKIPHASQPKNQNLKKQKQNCNKFINTFFFKVTFPRILPPLRWFLLFLARIALRIQPWSNYWQREWVHVNVLGQSESTWVIWRETVDPESKTGLGQQESGAWLLNSQCLLDSWPHLGAGWTASQMYGGRAGAGALFLASFSGFHLISLCRAEMEPSPVSISWPSDNIQKV